MGKRIDGGAKAEGGRGRGDLASRLPRAMTAGAASGLLAGLAVLGPSSAQAQAVVDNASGSGCVACATGTVNVPGNQASPWLPGGSLTVGNTNAGTLNIANGGTVSNTEGRIGVDAGSVGLITVNGATASWVSTGALSVGEQGQGTLNITNQGTVDADSVSIGRVAGGVGEVVVDGAGSSLISHSNVFISDRGNGKLFITNGGQVSGNSGMIGYHAGGAGSVVVDGAGSRLDLVTNLFVGNEGNGTLSITNGGKVASGNTMIGYNPSIAGSVTVDGAGSALSAGDLFVGGFGRGTLTIRNGAAVSAAASGTLVAVNPGSIGTVVIGGEAGAAPVAPGTLTSPVMAFGLGSGKLVLNHTDNSGNYIFAPRINSGGGVPGAVEVYAGQTVMTGQSTYIGPTTVFGGTLAAGVDNAFSPNSDYAVQTAGALNLNSHAQTVGSLSNAGQVRIGAPGGAPGAVLTVSGDYVSNSGSVLLNTHLGDDASPTDQLAVQGSVVQGAGATRLVVAGTGDGALTTGNGIRVVSVGGASPGGAFALGNRVAGGAYEYHLYHNGIGGSAGDGNWYLRSTIEVPVDPGTPPVDPGVPPGGPGAPPAGPGVPPAGVVELPDYRPEVPTYMAAPTLAWQLGLSTLGTYHDRLGQGPRDTNTWMRVYGENGRNGAGGNGSVLSKFNHFTGNGPSYDYDMGGFQFGRDLYQRIEAGQPSDFAGVYGGVGRISARVDQIFGGGRAGDSALDGYSLGAYWTRKGESGWYSDNVIQGTRYVGNANSNAGQSLNTTGWGFIASTEFGYPIPLAPGWALEPQAQLVYQHITLNGGSDAYGRVDYDDVNATLGRMGARVTKEMSTADGSQYTLWGRANVWQSFGGQTATTTFSNLDGGNAVSLNSNPGNSWGQIGLGVSGRLSKKVSAFASADYGIGFDRSGQHSLAGRVGVNIAW